MFRSLVLVVLCVVLSSCSSRPEFGQGRVSINDSHVIDVEVAYTQEQKMHGMMYMNSISDDYGMLFLYDKEQPVVMWMKNTYVSLDMFFMNKYGIVTHIEKNTEPLSLRHIQSSYLTKYVLETKAGFADKREISVGDKITVLKN